MFKESSHDHIVYYHLPLWAQNGKVSHGFFTRRGGTSQPPYGSLNVGPVSKDDPSHKNENIQRIASVFSIPRHKIFASLQVHGADILTVDEAMTGRSAFFSENPVQADALITDQKDIFLGVVTADCLPILILDQKRPALGVVHAGWRGTLQAILSKTVIRMRQAFQCRPENLWVALGPAIGSCCYKVGEEVAQAFFREDRASKPFIKPERRNQWRLDLAGLNQAQLLKQGVKKENIFILPLCTQCRPDLFFSVRAENEPTGRQLSLIGMASSSFSPS